MQLIINLSKGNVDYSVYVKNIYVCICIYVCIMYMYRM